MSRVIAPYTCPLLALDHLIAWQNDFIGVFWAEQIRQNILGLSVRPTGRLRATYTLDVRDDLDDLDVHVGFDDLSVHVGFDDLSVHDDLEVV